MDPQCLEKLPEGKDGWRVLDGQDYLFWSAKQSLRLITLFNGTSVFVDEQNISFNQSYVI